MVLVVLAVLVVLVVLVVLAVLAVLMVLAVLAVPAAPAALAVPAVDMSAFYTDCNKMPYFYMDLAIFTFIVNRAKVWYNVDP